MGAITFRTLASPVLVALRSEQCFNRGANLPNGLTGGHVANDTGAWPLLPQTKPMACSEQFWVRNADTQPRPRTNAISLSVNPRV